MLKDGTISEEVFVQRGVTDTSIIDNNPLVKTASLISSDELIDAVRKSRFVISHAGQGSTRMLVSQRASFIVLPRLVRYREHIDDHQLSFSQSVHSFGIQYCLEFDELKHAVLAPPPPLSNRQLFDGPKLSEYLCKIYPKTTRSSQTMQSTVT